MMYEIDLLMTNKVLLFFQEIDIIKFYYNYTNFLYLLSKRTKPRIS